MGMVVRLLCVSLLVGICLAVNGTPQDKAQAQLEPRLTEISKLKTQITDAAAANSEGDDCSDPPPRRCRWWKAAPHDPSDPNSPGWVLAKKVGMGQLPDDLKAKYPQWVTARTVPFLPEEPAVTGEGGPCCMCPQCGLSFYTPNDYWGHIVSCPAPGPKTCVQTVACLGNSHFDADPRVCMCRPGAAPSSSAAPAPTPLGSSSNAGSPGPVMSSGLSSPGNGTSANSTEPTPEDPLSSSSSTGTVDDTPVLPLNGSLIMTGSIGEPLTGGGVPSMIIYDDIQELAEEIGDEVAEAIGSGMDEGLSG